LFDGALCAQQQVGGQVAAHGVFELLQAGTFFFQLPVQGIAKNKNLLRNIY
jgi:hypothetical protein